MRTTIQVPGRVELFQPKILLVDNSKKLVHNSAMNLTTKQAIEAFRKLPQEQHDIILNGAELLAAKTGLPLTSCVHLIAECCLYVTYDGLSLTQANRGASERKR